MLAGMLLTGSIGTRLFIFWGPFRFSRERTALDDASGLGDAGNGDFEARNFDRELGALPRGWARSEPLDPLLVHAREVLFLGEDHGCADDLVQRAPGGEKNCGDGLQALMGLFLNSQTLDGAGRR